MSQISHKFKFRKVSRIQVYFMCYSMTFSTVRDTSVSRDANEDLSEAVRELLLEMRTTRSPARTRRSTIPANRQETTGRRRDSENAVLVHLQSENQLLKEGLEKFKERVNRRETEITNRLKTIERVCMGVRYINHFHPNRGALPVAEPGTNTRYQ